MNQEKSENINSTLSVLKNQNLFEHVVNQIEKDLMLSGLEVDSLEKSDPPSFLMSLAMIIEKLIKLDPEKLSILLYRVDVSEKEINKMFEQLALENMREAFSKLILIRTLQKIQTRDQLKSN